MTTLALIISILAFAKTPEGGVSQTMKALCWGIGIFGLIAVIAQIYSIVRKKIVRHHISEFYILGHNMMAKCFQPKLYDFDSLSQEYSTWRTDVQKFLRREFDESYVAKLDTPPAGMSGTPEGMKQPYDSVWRAMALHLMWLDRFSREKD